MKRIACTGKNKAVIDKEKMKPSMTKGQLYKVLSYQQRKGWYVLGVLWMIKKCCF